VSFIHPAVLWALPFAAVPVIIYYLMRFRSLRVEWGATYVLERALARLRKKLYADQLILLVLRTLLCVALVVAFARPAARRRAGLATSTGVHHVILVDSSYSMLAGPEDATRWDKTQETVAQLLRSWGRGETWSLGVMGDNVDWVVDGETLTDSEHAIARLGGLRVREGSTDLAPCLEAVFGRFATADVEIFLFADDQWTTWRNVPDLARGSIPGPDLYWIDSPSSNHENLAVTRAELARDKALRGHPVALRVDVANFGARPVRDVPVEILIDGAFRERKTVSLLPGQRGRVTTALALAESGSRRVTARLPDDLLVYDNSMSTAIDVCDRLDVLVLRDGTAEGKFDSAWEFLRIAGRLQNMQDDGKRIFTLGPVSVALCEASELDAQALATADVVLLDGARRVTPALATTLRGFVDTGGALILAADASVDPEVWNRVLGEAGLLPAPLGDRQTRSFRGDDCQVLRRADEGTSGGDSLDAAKFYSWFSLGEPVAGATVRATFADGTAYAIGKRMLPGSVTLLAAGLNGRDNNLIVRECFYPFIFDLLADSAGAALFPRMVGLGEPIACGVPDVGTIRAATFDRPGAEAIAVTPQLLAGGGRLQALGGSDVTGPCSMLVVGEDTATRIWFGAQGERVDSDLTPMDGEMRAAVQRQLGLRTVTDWSELQQALADKYGGREYGHWAMLVVLLAMLGELFAERRFV